MIAAGGNLLTDLQRLVVVLWPPGAVVPACSHFATCWYSVAIRPAGEAIIDFKKLENHPAQPFVQQSIQNVKNRDKQQNHFFHYNPYNQTCITLADSP